MTGSRREDTSAATGRPPVLPRGWDGGLDWRAEMRGASGSNLLAGLWTAASPWALEYPEGPVVANSVATGSLVAVFALVRVAGADRAAWLSWMNAIAGGWLAVSAFVIAGSGIALWNSLVFGITILGLAYWSARLSHDNSNGAPADSPLGSPHEPSHRHRD